MAAILINYPLKDVLSVFKIASKVFMHKAIPIHETVEYWNKIAQKARQNGLLELENEIEGADEFTKKGIQFLVDQVDSDIMNDILTTEIIYIQERHNLGQKIFTSLGNYAPAFGMVGTLIGLIQMLQKLNDPSQIGSGMGTALITTFYGAVMANLLFLPMAGKLKTRSKQEVQEKELIVLAINSIKDGDNPRLMREKLVTFLSPKLRLGDKTENKR
ncbi:MAG: motility protein A [Calditrichaeota bacterium]|nr:motility protein A [Calditrichota bacterium]